MIWYPFQSWIGWIWDATRILSAPFIQTSEWTSSPRSMSHLFFIWWIILSYCFIFIVIFFVIAKLYLPQWKTCRKHIRCLFCFITLIVSLSLSLSLLLPSCICISENHVESIYQIYQMPFLLRYSSNFWGNCIARSMCWSICQLFSFFSQCKPSLILHLH